MKKRTWVALILVGLVGQFAWTIENMYFNVFLYNAIAPDLISSVVAPTKMNFPVSPHVSLSLI